MPMLKVKPTIIIAGHDMILASQMAYKTLMHSESDNRSQQNFRSGYKSIIIKKIR